MVPHSLILSKGDKEGLKAQGVCQEWSERRAGQITHSIFFGPLLVEAELL